MPAYSNIKFSPIFEGKNTHTFSNFTDNNNTEIKLFKNGNEEPTTLINSIGIIKILQFDTYLNTFDNYVLKVYKVESGGGLTHKKDYPLHIIPNYKYLEIFDSLGNNNGIDNTFDGNAGSLYNTPFVARDCANVIVDTHQKHFARLGIGWNPHTDKIEIDDGFGYRDIINDDILPENASDIVHNFSNGILQNTDPNLGNPDANRVTDFLSIPFQQPFKVKTKKQFNSPPYPDNTQIGMDAMYIDNFGFNLIDYDNYPNFKYALNPSIPYPLPADTTIEVIIENDEYKTFINNVEDTSLARSTAPSYSASKGSVNLVGADYVYSFDTNNNNNYGEGYIEANFSGMIVRQKTYNVFPRIPNITSTSNGSTQQLNDNVLSNICPNSSVDLSKLNDTLLVTADDVELRFFTSNSPNPSDRITDLIITSNQTVYAFQYDSIADCYSDSGTKITVVINICDTTPDVDVTWDGINICSNDYLISPDYEGTNLTYKWYKDNVEIVGATNSTYLATQNGTYKVVVTNTADTAEGSGTIILDKQLSITQNLPNNITINEGDLQELIVVVDMPMDVTNIVWQRKVNNVWTNIVPPVNSFSFRPDRSGEYRVRLTSDCGTVTSKVTVVEYVRAEPIDDEFTTPRNTPITDTVVDNDTLCQGTIDGQVTRTFFKVKPDTLLPVGSGEITSFDEDTGEFTFTPAEDFIGDIIFDYDIYCTVDPTNDIDKADYNGTAQILIHVVCIIVEDFQIEHDAIAYYGGNPCYEQYRIVNIYPENAEIDNVIIEVEGIEITHPYDEDTKTFIGLIERKKNVKVKITIETCGEEITREIIQKVSLKPCC